MATVTTTTLVMSFTDDTGGTRTYRISGVNSEVSLPNVKAIIQAYITNQSIFSPQPMLAKSAKLETKTDVDYALDE